MVVLPLPFPKNYQQLIFSLCGWLEKRIESGCSCRAAKFVRIFLPSADCDFLGAPLFVLFTKPGLRRLLFVVFHTTFCDDDDEYSFCLPSLLLLLLCRFCCDELDGLANTLARTHSHSLTDHTFHSAAMLFLFFFLPRPRSSVKPIYRVPTSLYGFRHFELKRLLGCAASNV